VCDKSALNEIKEAAYRAAKEVLDDKLEKVFLFGSYARGDFDEESDIDIFVLANIPPEDVCITGLKIRRLTGRLELEHDVVVSIHVTCGSDFRNFYSVQPYYMNVINEGIEISYA